MFATYRNLHRRLTNQVQVFPKLYEFMGCVTSSQKQVNDKMNSTSVNTTTHFNCRTEKYPRGDVNRFPVPDNKVSWSVPFPEYNPVDFTTQSVLKQPVWADLDIRNLNSNDIIWNELDGKINRQSHMGKYQVIDGVPRNPIGRTGMRGRGSLGRWGPNHAADPIVSRWKRGSNGQVICDESSGKQILQFVAIRRKDSGIWAIPGGMVDAGEHVSLTLKREFSEEALNSLQATPEEKRDIEKNTLELFSRGLEIYRGYVDDPRNTDNSWMETVAYNFHDKTGESVGRFALNAGDDASGVRWTDINKNLTLFASHVEFIEKVARRHNAHW